MGNFILLWEDYETSASGTKVEAKKQNKTKPFGIKLVEKRKEKNHNEKSYIFVMIQCSISFILLKNWKKFISDDCLTGYCVNSAKCILHMIIQVKHFETLRVLNKVFPALCKLKSSGWLMQQLLIVFIVTIIFRVQNSLILQKLYEMAIRCKMNFLKTSNDFFRDNLGLDFNFVI